MFALLLSKRRDRRVIIYRAFYRESLKASLAIIVVLLIVLLLFGMTAVLGRAVRGEYAEDIVLALLGWQTLKRLDLVLPLGFYLGVLVTFSRWYRDSEMTVLSACGVGLPQLLRPVMSLAVVVALLAAVLAFYVTPLAAGKIELVKHESTQRPDVAGVAAGAFTESGVGGRILYAERVDADDGSLEQVFVSDPRRDRPRILVARAGHPYTEPRTRDQFLELRDGALYEGVPGQADYRVLEFASYALRVEPKSGATPPVTVEAAPTAMVFASDERVYIVEQHWRLAKPFMVLVLAGFAIALSFTDTRRGRLANLFAAILVYFIYSNLLGVGATLLKKGQVPEALGLWWVHGAFLALAAYWLARRTLNRPLLSLS